jgi:predicted Rossmann fold flavoprotein
VEHWDVVVLGGGAAGLFCALTAGARGKSVLVLEHNDKVGKKIGISGGGRCNFTNLRASQDNYISSNPEFCRSALARYKASDFLSLVESHGIAWHEKKLGQLFCNGSSREIIAMLVEECRRARAEVRCGIRVHDVSKPEKFLIRTSRGDVTCNALVVATGGLSFAKLGASDLGYRIARQFGLKLTEIRPGLVPLTFSPADKTVYGPLSGVSFPVTARCGKISFGEAMLITHRGLSGPAILQISNFWREGDTVALDLLPSESSIPSPGKESAVAQLSRFWPQRFAETWGEANLPAKPVAQWTAAERDRVQQNIHRWSPDPDGTEGYPKAEVTLGGVDTRELSSKTMEARSVPGLYFIGEVVDVTGWLGGYNFQWAWASAHAAGTFV